MRVQAHLVVGHAASFNNVMSDLNDPDQLKTPASHSDNLLWSIALVAAVLASMVCFRSRSPQGAVWTVPYLSGAANTSWETGWRVERASLAHYLALSPAGRWQYRAPRVAEGELMPFSGVNAVGFVYVVMAARTLFPWLGDLQAVVLLHCLVHLASCWLIFWHLTTGLRRGLFIVFYAANPLVICFVTFPFYYFWQALVPVCLVYSLFRDWKVPSWQALLMVMAAAASVWIRPSTLFLATGFASLLAWKSRWIPGAVLLLVFAAGVAGTFGGVSGTPAHTMFVGLGAYDSAEGFYLKDTSGYDYYERQTGEKVVKFVPDGFGGNWYDPDFRERFNRVLGQGVRDYAARHPGLLVRNAILNFLQGFSVGYKTEAPNWVRYAVASTGLLFILLMAFTRQWVLLAANALALGSFAPYFPPIPAYMFGSYLLLAVGAAVIGASWYENRRIRVSRPNGPCAYD